MVKSLLDTDNSMRTLYQRLRIAYPRKPKVSIVIPVFNRPLLLRRALESVQAQTFPNWEAIVVDDGSTDHTADVAEEFAAKDKRFRVIRNPHEGGAKTANDGMALARGTYITLLDSDDEYKPEHLAIRVEKMERHPDVDILHGGFVVVGSHMVADKRDMRKSISLYDEAVYIGGTYFAKCEVFVALGGFLKLSYAWDSEFLERATLHYRVLRIYEPTYVYHRDRQDSVTSKIEQLRVGSNSTEIQKEKCATS